MKKRVHFLGFLLVALSISLVAEEKQAAVEEKQTHEIGKISESFGHMIGKNLDNIGFKFDIAKVIKGMQDESSGKVSPMTEMECVQAIASIQEELFKKQSAENLEKAEKFLQDNKKHEGIVSLEEGKVQYKVDAAGEGTAIESHFAPLILYTGKYLDGTVFSASKEQELISLDEIIPGLKAGLVGMKEGEKRTVYIHPDLAYGASGYVQPNSLLTFEIEVVKANAPKAESTAATTAPSNEIAEIKTDVR